MEPKITEQKSYFIKKQEIIDKFEIPVGPEEDTWSYYRDHVLEIKVIPKPPPAPEEVKDAPEEEDSE